MSFETILYDVDDNILTITLNRPEQLNSFNGKMCFELIEAFDMGFAQGQTFLQARRPGKAIARQWILISNVVMVVAK
jgi:hypothetical protein